MFNLELRQLRYFLELSKTLNFSRAAENLYISQPTLSQQIAALEEEMRVRLFVRNHHKVALTVAGKELLQYCVQIFALLDEAKERVRIAETGTGTETPFVFGIDESTTHLDQDGFFDIMERFQKKFPEFKSSMKFMHYQSVLSALNSGEIDLGISIITRKELETIPPSLGTFMFREQAVVLCIPNLFYKQYGDDYDRCIHKAITELELCLLSSDERWTNNFRDMFRDGGLPFHPVYHNGYNTICTYVQAGKGMMVDIELAVTAECRTFCTPVPFPWETAKVANTLIWNKNRLTPMLKEFLKLFQG